jgi:hypothetical protein
MLAFAAANGAQLPLKAAAMGFEGAGKSAQADTTSKPRFFPVLYAVMAARMCVLRSRSAISSASLH